MQRSQKCGWLSRPRHSCVSRMSQPLSPAHGTTQPPTPTLHRRFLPTEPRALLTARRRSYTFPAATLPNPTPKLRSRATRASLLMHTRLQDPSSWNGRHGVPSAAGCPSTLLPPEGCLWGRAVHPVGESC